MTTQVQTIQKSPARPSRPHDYLYDPIYTVSSDKDHSLAAARANRHSSRIKKITRYPTMFSDTGPRSDTVMDPRGAVTLPKDEHQQNIENSADLSTMLCDQNIQTRNPENHTNEADVDGKDRSKFFKRANVNYSTTTTEYTQETLYNPLEQMESNQIDEAAISQQLLSHISKSLSPSSSIRHAMTQTDYRESETQTDPYTPEYILRDGENPEILSLKTLTYGHGLPVGQEEIEMIERARAKRIWEANLPPLSDKSQLEKRREMMEAMEMQEWKQRELDIEKVQSARLKILEQLLREREKTNDELLNKKLDTKWAKREREKTQLAEQVHKEHLRNLRKLNAKRENVEELFVRRDIIKDYGSGASNVYSPMMRNGVPMDKFSENNIVQNKYNSTYKGLVELETYLGKSATSATLKQPESRQRTKSGFTRRKFRHEEELRTIYNIIHDERVKKKEPEKPLRFLQHIEKPVPRPPTPSVEPPDEVQNDKNRAAVFLQKLINGRATQNMMTEGIEKRRELIKELRSTHALRSGEVDALLKQEEGQIKEKTEKIEFVNKLKEKVHDQELSAVEGACVSEVLDLYSKELIRLQQERKIHAMAMLAERQRRMREAEESGLRQHEERRRREHDEIFKQVVKVHQESVDMYLEDIFLGAIDTAAGEQAREKIEQRAVEIDRLAQEVHQRNSELEHKEVAAELVEGFLLPEIHKKRLQQKDYLDQYKELMNIERGNNSPSTEDRKDSNTNEDRENISRCSQRSTSSLPQQQVLSEMTINGSSALPRPPSTQRSSRLNSQSRPDSSSSRSEPFRRRSRSYSAASNRGSEKSIRSGSRSPSGRGKKPRSGSGLPSGRSERSMPGSGLPSGRSERSMPGSGLPSGRSERSMPGSGLPNGRSERSMPGSELSSGRSERPRPESGLSSGRSERSRPESGLPSGRSERSRPNSGPSSGRGERSRADSRSSGGRNERSRKGSELQNEKDKRSKPASRSPSGRGERSRADSKSPGGRSGRLRADSRSPSGRGERSRADSRSPSGRGERSRQGSELQNEKDKEVKTR